MYPPLMYFSFMMVNYVNGKPNFLIQHLEYSSLYRNSSFIKPIAQIFSILLSKIVGHSRLEAIYETFLNKKDFLVIAIISFINKRY